MKKILKLLSLVFGVIVVMSLIFLGYMFVKVSSIKKEMEAMESFDYEVMYHISGDCDIFDMDRYDNDDTSMTTRWFTSYIKKMEQGGRISGEAANEVMHGDVYAEGEDVPSIEFYYEDQAVFGIKKTMDYIIDTVEKETELPLSILKEVTPEGYVTMSQIQRLLGEETVNNSSGLDFIEEGKKLFNALKWVIPASGKGNYFESKLDEVKMTYCAPIVTIDGTKGAQMTFGLGNESDDIYLYMRMNEVNGCEDSDLEMLIHIQENEGQHIEIPEIISDEVIDALASALAFLNNLVK